MSKHNYSQYSSKKNSAPAVSDNIATMTPVEIELVHETVETAPIPETVSGVVVNCAKLNVRSEPSLEADVVYVLGAMSEIEIDVSKSTDDWFYICTASGIEGYCMRQFVDAYL